MQNLLTINIENNSELGPVVSSRIVAEEINRRHTDVIRDLENILKSENADLRSLIIPNSYKVSRQNRSYKEYLLTKDGFTLYMFNIQGHNDFKMAYINKFNEMEEQLNQQYQVPTNSMEALEMMFQATKTEVANIKSDVIDLRENQRLDPGEYNHLSSAISKRVNFIKNQYALTSNRKVTSELYKDINSEVKKMTGVQTRSQLKQKHFNDVIDMINNWYPSQSTVYVIRQLQISIEESY